MVRTFQLSSHKIALSLLAVLFVEGSVRATTPQNAKVVSASLAGSGCPANASAEAELSGDGRLTVRMPEFVAKSGANTRPSEARANCNVSITIDHGGKKRLAAKAASLHVEGRLGSTEARVAVKAYFQGQAATESAETTLTGDVQGKTVELAPKKNFSPCASNATLVLNFSVFLKKGSASNDAAQLSVKPLTTDLEWESCQ